MDIAPTAARLELAGVLIDREARRLGRLSGGEVERRLDGEIPIVTAVVEHTARAHSRR